MESNNNKETTKDNTNKPTNTEVNDTAMKNIKKNLDGVISGYLEQFTKKFDTFMGQMRVADVLLKAFEYRYDKIQGKIGNINDVLSYDYQKHSIFNQRCSDLAGLEVKMSSIEQKLGLIESKIEGLIEMTQKKKTEENKDTNKEDKEENKETNENKKEEKEDIKKNENNNANIEDKKENSNEKGDSVKV